MIALSLGALVSCGSHGNAPAPDGGGPALTTDVVGTYHNTCHQPSGDADMPVDLSQGVTQAFVPDGSPAGYRLVTGTGSADGAFVLHDVPVGATYLLYVSSGFSGIASYLATDQHVIDLRGEVAGRCSPLPAKASAPIDVTLDLTNMSPFAAATDRMELDSFSLGVGVSVPFNGSPDTELHASATWPQGFPLVDAAAGDDLHVVHFRSDQVTGPAGGVATAQHILDVFDATGTTLQVGTPVSLTGAFPPPAPAHTGTLSIDHARFESGYDGTSLPVLLSVELRAQPGASTGFGSFGRAAVLLDITMSGIPTLPVTGTTTTMYSYADPFPASWNRSFAVSYDRFHLVKLSSDPFGIDGFGGAYEQRIASSGAIGAEPVLAPPTGITVAGVDFERGGKIAFDGQAPIAVRWNPLPGAQLYRFSLAHVTADQKSAAINVTTADTSLVLPAALVETGTLYQLTLQAIQTPTDYRGGHLLPAVLPFATAGVPSGRFRFLPSCGDGVMQAGEDCDAGGESATCNADCTAALCGDGVINATAGEQCDATRETADCTADCKLP